MTQNFKVDLDNVKLNQHAKYLGQRLLILKVIVQTHTHIGPNDLPRPLKCLVTKGIAANTDQLIATMQRIHILYRTYNYTHHTHTHFIYCLGLWHQHFFVTTGEKQWQLVHCYVHLLNTLTWHVNITAKNGQQILNSFQYKIDRGLCSLCLGQILNYTGMLWQEAQLSLRDHVTCYAQLYRQDAVRDRQTSLPVP